MLNFPQMKKALQPFLYLYLFLFLPAPVLAAVNIETDFTDAPWKSFPDPGTFVSLLLKNAYILAGILFFLLLFAGGFMIIMGGSGGDAKKTQQGKEAATWAVIGFFVIFASYWIIQIIQVVTGVKILEPGI